MIRRFSGIFVFLFCLSAFSEPLSWQTFTYGKINWICSSNGINVFSTDSRTVYPLTLDQTRVTGKISDIIQSDNSLVISAESGIYLLDMSTQSIERIPFPGDRNMIGKIASDMDYLWVTSEDSLFRFDKLGREWLSYALPQKVNIKTLLGDGTTVECIGEKEVYSFTISTEKWNVYKTNTDPNDSTRFFHCLKSVLSVNKKQFQEYKTDAHLWEKHECRFALGDFIADDTVMYYSDGERAVHFSNGVSRPIDIPGNGEIYALTKNLDTLYLALKSGIMKYNLKNAAMSFLDYPSQIGNRMPEKIFVNSNFITLVSGNSFSICNIESRTWNFTERVEKKSAARFSWGDQGPVIQYKPGLYTNIKGYIESKSSMKSAGYFYDTTAVRDKNGRRMYDSLGNPVVKVDSVPLFKLKNPDLIADVNVHSSDPDGRILDLSFDNFNQFIPPKKIISYRGTKSDMLNSLKVGTCQTDIMQSQLSTPVQYEGGQLVVESKSKVEGRDRKIARVAGGGGFITTRSQWKLLHYRADGLYYLGTVSDTNREDALTLIGADTVKNSIKSSPDTLITAGGDSTILEKSKDTTQILPGSLRIWVDGALLDSVYYTFFVPTKTLKIEPTAPIDPVSLITVSYKVQPIPELGNKEVEFKPSHNFGEIYNGTAVVSPTKWLSARVGVESVNRDSLKTVVNAALPIELRKDKPDLLVKFTPELSVNPENKSKAGAVDFQSRIGKSLGLTFNSLFVDSNFNSADTFTRGYGKTKSEYNAGVNYDILPEIPVRYSQHKFTGTSGSETNYSASTGLHFQRLPFLNVDVSRTVLDKNDTAKTLDSLFHTKDRVTFKLFETSSPLLERFLRSKKVAYELIHAEYRYNNFESEEMKNGRRTDLNFVVMPLQQITFTGRNIYKSGDLGNGAVTSFDPSIEVLTSDFPKGIDIIGSYRATEARYSDSTKSGIDRGLELILKPGRYTNYLRWFTLDGSIGENLNCAYYSFAPDPAKLSLGLDGKKVSVLTRMIGFNFFPNERSFFRNKNQWSQTDTIKKFTSTNNLEINFDSRNSWVSTFTYNNDNQYYKMDGSSYYRTKVTSWLQLTPEIKGNVQTDSIGNKIAFGPQLSTSISTEKWRFLKNLFNDQSVSLVWNRRNGHTENHPDLSYSFRFDLIILPDLKISNQETLSYTDGSFSNFTGNLVGTIIF